MSFFNTQFAGAPMQITDAMKAREFTERTKDKERARQDQAKALSEDQKRMGMIAQGLGLQKGEIDSMSRGELQGFITNSMQSKADQQAQQEQLLSLQKFMSQEAQLKAQQAYQQGQQDIQRINANTASTNAEASKINANVSQGQFLSKFQVNQAELNESFNQKTRTENNNKAYHEFVGKKVVEAENGNVDAQKWLNINKDAVESYNAGQTPDMVASFQGKGDPAKLSASEEINNKASEQLAIEASKDYAEWVNDGGYTKAEEKVKVFRNVVTQLSNGSVETGGIINAFSDAFRIYTNNSDGVALQQEVNRIIALNLKDTLGAQFTEKEAKQLMERSYDPRLKSVSNIAKLNQAILEIVKKENFRIQYFNVYKQDPSKLRTFNYDPNKSTFDKGTGQQSTRQGLQFNIKGLTPTNP